MHTHYLTQLLLICWLLFFCGCKRKIEPIESISIGVQDNSFSALVLIADQMGYFKEEGVDVKIEHFSSGKMAHKALLRGEVDLCTVADMPVAAGGLSDSSIIVASIGKTNREKRISARKDHGIERATDLKGKRVGTQRNSAVHYFLSVFLIENLIPADSVEMVFMPAVELPDALEQGYIDAFSMRNPFSQEIKNRLGDNIVEFYSNKYLGHLLLVKAPNSSRETDKAVTRVLKALVKSEALCMEKKDEAITAVIKGLPGDRSTEVTNEFDDYQFSLSLDMTLLLILEKQFLWTFPEKRVIPDYFERIEPSYLKSVKPSVVTVEK